MARMMRSRLPMGSDLDDNHEWNGIALLLFPREMARGGKARRLGDPVAADRARAAQARDRRDDPPRAATARSHLRYHEIAEPEIALHVRAHDLVEGLVREAAHGAIDRIDGGVADQDVHRPET